MIRNALMIVYCLLVISCRKDNTSPPVAPLPPAETDSLYFPPLSGTTWQTTDPSVLEWNQTELNNLFPYLQSKNTKAFIVLQNGKIVVEKYYDSFTADSIWYWASAGKTLTAFLTGIAQQEGIININNPSSLYLGNGWTSAPANKESLITVRNQLTMTTGLDDGVSDNSCTLPACLQFRADAGTRWAYHNAAYTLLDKVIENASGSSFNGYFQQKLRNRIGMNGLWIKSPNSNNVFYSNARSMARFGLLMLNNGIWENTAILNDSNYFRNMINTSQNLNQSYGYLTWLNGKSSHMLPAIPFVRSGTLFPNAPADMYSALGKNDQKIYVVPSKKLVVIRMGNSAGDIQSAASAFDNELWGKLMTIIN